MSRPCKIHFSKIFPEPNKGKPVIRGSTIDTVLGLLSASCLKDMPMRQPKQAQQKALQGQTHHCPHQPAQLVAHSTTQRVQRITRFTLQPAALHALERGDSRHGVKDSQRIISKPAQEQTGVWSK